MNLYETDFHAWAFEQAQKIRAGEAIDAENVAEELESLGRSEQQQLESRLTILLTHLLKWEFQPDRRSSSWKGTIKEQRHRIARLLLKMPSLQACLDESIADAYAIARISAGVETGMVEEDFPSECPYSTEQILSEQ
jgi:ribosomal protein L29